MSAGHNCWGILWAPVSGEAMSDPNPNPNPNPDPDPNPNPDPDPNPSQVSGKAMSELLLDGTAACVDLKAFDPARFAPRASKRGRKQGQTPVGEQW